MFVLFAYINVRSSLTMQNMSFNCNSLHVQVAGVVGRAETLSAFFFLSCLFTYQNACSQEDRTSRCTCVRMNQNLYLSTLYDSLVELLRMRIQISQIM